jgi:hypothetical protein
VRGRHLGEACFPGQRGDALLVLSVPVAVQQDHGGAAEPVVVGGPQVTDQGVRVERGEDLAGRGDPFGDLDYPVVQHLGQHDLAVEDARPVLVGDAQGVGEAAGDDQDGGLALALEQGVGGDGGAQPDGSDAFGGKGVVRSEAEQLTDTGHGGVAVGPRVVGQQLVRDQAAVRALRDDIGEGAAPVDPELPACVQRRR